MKKLYSTIMLLAMMVTALSFTACGSDNDEEDEVGNTNSSFLVGTWSVDEEDSYEDEFEYVQYKSNGTYINVQYDEDGLYISKGTWKANDSEIIMKETEGDLKGSTYTYTILSKGQSQITVSMWGLSSILRKVPDSTIDKYIK